MRKTALGITLLGVLPACSSIIEGTSQEIMVNTNPAGANCSLMRQGNSIARIDPTPGAATIKKLKYDITIVCNKDGFEEATYLNHSGVRERPWKHRVRRRHWMGGRLRIRRRQQIR